jgi:putative transposase
MGVEGRRYHRRSLRLADYVYTSAGSYFVTVNGRNRSDFFGEIVQGEMRLNAFGEIIHRCWLEIPYHFPQVELDGFMVMPDHIHGIILIVGATHGIHRSPG